MIFRFTDQEKETLQELERRYYEERAQASGDSDRSPLQIRIKYAQDFQKALREIELSHYVALQGKPELILQDAQERAEECLYFAADWISNELFIADKEHGKNPPKDQEEPSTLLVNLISGPGKAGVHIVQDMTSWDWDRFRGMSEQIKDNITFPADTAGEWIRKYIVSDHISALGKSREGKKLAKFIDDLLHRLPFVIDPEGVGDPGAAETTGKKKKKDLPKVKGLVSSHVLLPIDPGNRQVFYLPDTIYSDQNSYIETETGQMALYLEIETIPAKKNKPAGTVTYMVDFSALDGTEYAHKLEPYDRMVFNACATLIENGNEIVTIQTIYEQMKDDRTANPAEKKKIFDSIEKMRLLPFRYSNETEVENFGKTKVTVGDYFLPAKTIKVSAGGNETDGVKFLGKLPMFEQAKEKRQITSVRREILNPPVNLNKRNIAITFYLIESIKRMKKKDRNGKPYQEPKLTYQKLYETFLPESKDPKEKTRLKDTVKRILDYYKTQKFIRDYHIADKGKSIIFDV